MNIFNDSKFTIKKTLKKTATTDYSAGNMAIEVIFPNRSRKWFEGQGDVSTTTKNVVINSEKDVSGGSITTTVDTPDLGIYRVKVYTTPPYTLATEEPQYTLLFSTMVKRAEEKTELVPIADGTTIEVEV